MQRDELKIVIGVHRLANDIDRRTSRLLLDYDLTLGQFAVLECLFHKGDLSVGEVQEKILSSSGTIPVIIRNLEKRKLIARIQDIADKRRFILHLTDKGKELIEKAYPENERMIFNSLDIYTEEEKATLVALLKKYKEKGNE